MHILILADTIDDQKAGVHVYTRNLIGNLLEIDKKTHFSFIHKSKNSFFKNTKHYIIPHKKIPFYGKFRKFFLIPRLIRKLKPDLVFEPCHLGPFNLPKNIKKAVMIHDLTPINMPHFHDSGSARRHRFFLKKILKKSDLILCSSESTARDIKKYCPQAKNIQIIPLATEKPERKKLPSPLKKPYLLHLGTIEPRKNLETLITVFNQIKKNKKIPHKLLLAGEMGWKSSRLKKLIEKSPDIILSGYVSEQKKAAYLQNATALIYPSFYEGFGLPPLEAMSYKTPVICSNGGSLKELYNKVSLQFAPKNESKLKKHILSVIESPQKNKKMIEKAYRYSKNFSWKNTAKQTLDAFHKTINNDKIQS